MENESIDDVIARIILDTEDINQRFEVFQREHKAVFDELEEINALRAEIEERKAKLKEQMIREEDFDLHKVQGMKISVCPITKLAVEDEDLVDEKYKTTGVVINTKKAQDHKKLYGVVPAGFRDATYYRMDWKEDK